jgi:hypothetical protein
MLAQVADLDPPFLNEPPHETRPDVKPRGDLIDREQAINGVFRFGHSRLLSWLVFRWFHVKHSQFARALSADMSAIR